MALPHPVLQRLVKAAQAEGEQIYGQGPDHSMSVVRVNITGIFIFSMSGVLKGERGTTERTLFVHFGRDIM